MHVVFYTYGFTFVLIFLPDIRFVPMTVSNWVKLKKCFCCCWRKHANNYALTWVSFWTATFNAYFTKSVEPRRDARLCWWLGRLSLNWDKKINENIFICVFIPTVDFKSGLPLSSGCEIQGYFQNFPGHIRANSRTFCTKNTSKSFIIL